MYLFYLGNILIIMIEHTKANYYIINISCNVKIKINKNNCTASTISYFCSMLRHRLHCHHNPAFELSLIFWSISTSIAVILFVLCFPSISTFPTETVATSNNVQWCPTVTNDVQRCPTVQSNLDHAKFS